jgi:Sortase domain
MTSQPSATDSSRSSRGSRSSGSGSGPTLWWVVTVGLLLIGTGFFVAGFGGFGGSNPTHRVLPMAASSGPVAARRYPVTVQSTPVSLRIPALGVSSSLSELGLNADKSPQVPTDYQEAGWYKLGPAPGQMGSAVILGHVDDTKGPAVFYKLGSLKAGDKVEVNLRDGSIVHFVVTTVATYLKTRFPSQQVYGSHGYSGLQLVTCGGRFNSVTGHYLSNVVVYTTMVSTTPAKAA